MAASLWISSSNRRSPAQRHRRINYQKNCRYIFNFSNIYIHSALAHWKLNYKTEIHTRYTLRMIRLYWRKTSRELITENSIHGSKKNKTENDIKNTSEKEEEDRKPKLCWLWKKSVANGMQKMVRILLYNFWNVCWYHKSIRYALELVEHTRMYFSGRVHVGFNFRRNEQFIFTVNRLYA